MACIAGFMAGSSLPQVAEGYSGVWRWVHDKAGPLAIAFVIAATVFSLCTQAYALGSAAATLSAQLDLSPGQLLPGRSCMRCPSCRALPPARRVDDRQPGAAPGRSCWPRRS